MSDRPDLQDLARRYVELYLDQIENMTRDPEILDGLTRLFGNVGIDPLAIWQSLWSAAFTSASPFRSPNKPQDTPPPAPQAEEEPCVNGAASSGQAASGSPAARAASRDRDAYLAKLEARIALLEERLTDMGEDRPG